MTKKKKPVDIFRSNNIQSTDPTWVRRAMLPSRDKKKRRMLISIKKLSYEEQAEAIKAFHDYYMSLDLNTNDVGRIMFIDLFDHFDEEYSDREYAKVYSEKYFNCELETENIRKKFSDLRSKNIVDNPISLVEKHDNELIEKFKKELEKFVQKLSFKKDDPEAMRIVETYELSKEKYFK